MSHPEHIITAGKPVIGDQLIGRQKEIGLINHYLDTGQSVVLIAPRRYGKTSLLLEILRQRQRAGNYTASVDFFAIASILALAAEITAQVLSNKKWTWSVYQLRTQLFELLKNMQFRQTVDQYDFILGFGNAQPDEWQLLSESLKLIDTFAGDANITSASFYIRDRKNLSYLHFTQ
jgi:AAA+ ATPase superfamily predicted ATPase